MNNYKNASTIGTENLRTYVQGNVISGESVTGEIDRITKYYLYWNFYKGLHWRINNYTMMRFNYVRAFVDKVAQFLIGKESFSIQIKNYGNVTIGETVETEAEKYILKQWNINQRPILSYKILQMGGVCGDAWVFVSWDTIKNNAIIHLCDSRYSFPEFEKGEVGKMSKFTIRQPLEPNTKKYVVKVIEYTPDTIKTWYQMSSSIDDIKYEMTEQLNALGFIPVVHIQNKPYSEGYYSVSDIEDIIGLNKTYNELAQEIKSIIDYYVAPTTIVTGATLGNVTKKLGTIWSGLPPEANVFNLGLDADLSATTTFMDKIKTAMHEMSDVPENFLGKIQPISNTSAAALQLTYQPIIQQADLKWLTYGAGIEKINSIIIKLARLYENNRSIIATLDSFSTTGRFEDEFIAAPIFPYGFPNDKMTELQTADYELRLKLNSRRRILERMGENNIPDLMKEIEADAIRTAKLDGKIMQLSGQMMGMGLGAPPQEGGVGAEVTPPTMTANDVLNTPDANNPPKQG